MMTVLTIGMGHSRAHIFDVKASVCVYAHLLIDLLRQLLELCLQSHNLASAPLGQKAIAACKCWFGCHDTVMMLVIATLLQTQ